MIRASILHEKNRKKIFYAEVSVRGFEEVEVFRLAARMGGIDPDHTQWSPTAKSWLYIATIGEEEFITIDLFDEISDE